MKLGFIGFGKMGQAICQGVLAEGLTSADQVLVSDKDQVMLKALGADYGIQTTTHNQEVYTYADVIILAIKPQHLAHALEGLDLAAARPFVISIAAGVKREFLGRFFEGGKYLRTMPNLNAQVGESITALVNDKQISQADLTQAQSIFQAVGQTAMIDESQMDIFTAIGGSSPALVFLLIDLLARAAVRHGMAKDQADQIASQAVLGSAKTALTSGKNLWELIDHVSSPGGTTIEGVLSLLEDDFARSVVKSVDAVADKSKHMG